MKIAHTKEEMLAAARKLASSQGIWTVDGFDGVGKSTIASQLARELGAGLVEVDRFLFPGERGYVQCISADALRQAIDISSAKHSIILVEGICVREVLDALGVISSISVYIKEFLRGSWKHEALITEAPSVAQMREAREWGRPIAGIYLNYLYDDLIPYHINAKPHEKADLLVER